MKNQLKNYRFIFVPLALGIILPSLIISWVTINLLGQYSFSPLDIIRSAISGYTSQFDLLYLSARYTNSYLALVFSMITYITSIAMMILSIGWKKNKSKIILIAGILAMASGLLWIYTIESFKINFIQTAISAGGIIGEEWKGRESIVANSIVIMGFGHYLVILSGMISILAYFWRN